MGCGASTAVPTSSQALNQNTGSVSNKRKSIVNGINNNINRVSNSVNQSDRVPKSPVGVTETVANGIDTKAVKLNGTKLNKGLFQRQLSRIEESLVERGADPSLNPLSDSVSVAVQTETDSIYGIKTQYTQTDLVLFPEDELELLMQNISGDMDLEKEHEVSEQLSSDGNVLEDGEEGDVHNYRSSDQNDVEYQVSSTNVFVKTEPDQSNKAMATLTIDVGIQVKKSKTTISTQTRLTIFQDKMSAKLFRRRPSHVKKSNKSPLRAHPHDQANQRLWTAPSKITDIDPNTMSPKLHDFESQTDPVSQALAANAAGNDLNVLHSYDISSPFSHIEKELYASGHSEAKGKNNFDLRLQECLNKLLDDMEDSFGVHKSVVKRKDVAVQTKGTQTLNDPITDEAPEYAARPPPSRKKEMIPNIALFREIDRTANEAPESVSSELQLLVDYLCKNAINDFFKVRAIFRWITLNIRYDWKYMGITLSSSEILASKEGVCKDYCLLFQDMCKAAGLRVKKIQGFAKGYDYRPGHQFKPGEDITHNWNAVYVLGAWRFVDTTWGTGFTDHSGKFQRKLNEHFFLTDPEILIWTHFPFDEMEANYSRWQLLDKPISLLDFNSLPKVTPFFFEFNLKIRTKLQNPIAFRVQTEIKIGSHEPMRYKYKLYPADEVENSSLNHYAFCQLKEDRLVGSFIITPPVEGRYFLKLYTKPEREMLEGTSDSSSLHSAVTFLVECSRARKYIEPYPLNELPWGPTQAFFDFKMKIHNQIGPVISTWGGKRKLVMESMEQMLITYQIMDSEGMEMDVRSIVNKDDVGLKSSFTISPPRVGIFKFMIFGMPKPKQKGKWRLPLLATFLIDCKLAKLPPQDEDPPPMPANMVPDDDDRTRKHKVLVKPATAQSQGKDKK